MGFRAEKVGVRGQTEERAGRRRGAAAEVRVVRAGVVVAKDEAGVARKIRVDAAEDVGERIVLQHPLAGARISETPGLQITGKRIDVGRVGDSIRRADERSGCRRIQLLPFRVQEEEEMIPEERSAEGKSVLLLL